MIYVKKAIYFLTRTDNYRGLIMKTAVILVAFALLASCALATPDSISCRTVDWLDVPGATCHYGSDGDGEYAYPGTWLWDMAMGDSFLVWCPGGIKLYLVDPYDQTDVDTFSSCTSYSYAFRATAVLDSFVYVIAGGFPSSNLFEGDSLRYISDLFVPGADFSYAVIRDTFLYTASTGYVGLNCINIANPESLFVAWTAPYFVGWCGMALAGDYVYTASAGEYYVSPPDDYHKRPNWEIEIVKIYGDTIGIEDSCLFVDYMSHGDFASDGEHPFYVYTDMTDWLRDVQDYTLGDSYLKVWGTDYSYTWADYDSEGVFGVEVLNDTIIAVGFEHGFSIIDYTQLGGMNEVAYYRDPDSIFAFTHFARKGNRMYAMAHPRTGICRMYMFELDEDVWTSIKEPIFRPNDFEFRSYPNPFNSSVTICLDFGSESPQALSTSPPGACRVEVFDINGRRVAEIPLNPPLTRGTSDSPLVKGGQGGIITWQPDAALGSGVYLVRATMSGSKGLKPLVQTKSIVYLK